MSKKNIERAIIIMIKYNELILQEMKYMSMNYNDINEQIECSERLIIYLTRQKKINKMLNYYIKKKQE